MDGVTTGYEYLGGYYYPGATVGAAYTTTMDNSGNYVSGYFSNTDTSSSAASTTQTSDETRAFSYMDMKFQSYFHSQSYLSFIQVGLEDAYLRQFPYQMSYLSEPTSCKVEDTTMSYCQTAYNNYKCGNSAASTYAPYDPRCRSWYALGRTYQSSPNVYFQRPRLSSTGAYVVTAVSPIISKTQQTFVGVINFNYLVTTLSSAINALPIMSNGYAFLVDATATTQIILHPRAPNGCLLVSCAETAFSASEFSAFNSTVLAPIQSNAVLMTSLDVATTFQKGGATWRLAYFPVVTGSINYVLIAVVPQSDILAASVLIQAAIDKTVVSMIAAFVICMVFFCLIMFAFARSLTRAVVDPFQDLQEICSEIIQDDLTSEVPTHASSLDMHILLDAFSNLMIALRFGSDSYQRGDRSRALSVFEDALKLYSATNNKRGIGASHNNLGAVKMSLGNLDAAEEHYKQAIANAEGLLEMMTGVTAGTELKNTAVARRGSRTYSEADIARIRRILSDRKGNLALLYLERKDDREAFSKAFDILSELLKEDSKNAYVKGCVVKQGSLGQFYLKQKEFKSAERTFVSSLEFIRRKDEGLYNAQWNATETSAAEQIALCNIAFLRAEEAKLAEAESAYLETIMRPVSMNVSTTNMALNALFALYKKNGREAEATQLAAIAAREKFLVGESAGGVGPKRVAFVVDYSGSMAGGKITSAIDNVLLIFNEHVSTEDQCMLMHFESQPFTDFPMMPKKGNEAYMQKTIDGLRRPGGATAFFDALIEVKKHFTGKPGNDWVIALTDGEDTTSRIAHSQLLIELKKTKGLNLIVIGIGFDVKTEELSAIAKTSEKGVYLFADGSKEGITKAFGQVALLIQGQVMLEEL